MGSVFENVAKDLAPMKEARQQRFGEYWKFYTSGGLGSSELRTPTGNMMKNRIGNAVQTIFTPLGRAVVVDSALIPGQWELAAGTDQATLDWVNQVFKWSKWRTAQNDFTVFYSALGESGLRVQPAPGQDAVALIPVRPDTYVYKGDPYNPDMFVEFYMDYIDGDEVERAVVVTPDTVETFVDGAPAGWGDNPASYANPLGVVPLVVAQNTMGQKEPVATFDNMLVSLHKANYMATYMVDIIKRHLEPQWVAFGAEATELEKSGDNVWFFPEGANIEALLAQIDFPGLLSFIQMIKDDMKENLPELAFARLVGTNRVATDTIELEMFELVAKINLMRGPVDTALEHALGLAAKVGAQYKLGGPGEGAMVEFNPARGVIQKDNLTKIRERQAGLALAREEALGMGA